MLRLSIGALSPEELFELAKKDNICEILVPSDIRALAFALSEKEKECSK